MPSWSGGMGPSARPSSQVRGHLRVQNTPTPTKIDGGSGLSAPTTRFDTVGRNRRPPRHDEARCVDRSHQITRPYCLNRISNGHEPLSLGRHRPRATDDQAATGRPNLTAEPADESGRPWTSVDATPGSTDAADISGCPRKIQMKLRIGCPLSRCIARRARGTLAEYVEVLLVFSRTSLRVSHARSDCRPIRFRRRRQKPCRWPVTNGNDTGVGGP